MCLNKTPKIYLGEIKSLNNPFITGLVESLKELQNIFSKLCNCFDSFPRLNNFQISEICIVVMHNTLLKLYKRNCIYNE